LTNLECEGSAVGGENSQKQKKDPKIHHAEYAECLAGGGVSRFQGCIGLKQSDAGCEEARNAAKPILVGTLSLAPSFSEIIGGTGIRA